MTKTIKAKQVKTPKSEQRKRTDYIRARVTPDMKAEFLKRCSDAGLSSTDYILKKVLDEKPIHKIPRVKSEKEVDLIKVLAQMGKWGSNVNQMAHVLNMAKNEQSFNVEYALKSLKPYEEKLSVITDAIIECRNILRKTLLSGDFKV